MSATIHLKHDSNLGQSLVVRDRYDMLERRFAMAKKYGHGTFEVTLSTGKKIALPTDEVMGVEER